MFRLLGLFALFCRVECTRGWGPEVTGPLVPLTPEEIKQLLPPRPTKP